MSSRGIARLQKPGKSGHVKMRASRSMHCELNCEVGVGNGRNARNRHLSIHPRKRKKRHKKEKAGKILRPYRTPSYGRGRWFKPSIAHHHFNDLDAMRHCPSELG